MSRTATPTMIGGSGYWEKQYTERGAFWYRDLNFWDKKKPHALLTSKKHSNGYFNSELVAQNPLVLDHACEDLVKRLISVELNIGEVHRVVGPAMGAVTMAHDTARNIARRGFTRQCLCAYTTKGAGHGEKTMVFEKSSIMRGENVLIVEDVLTTGESVELTAKAVKGAGGIVLPFVAVLVNRSGLEEVGGKKIVALINKNMRSWNPEDCPLCKLGSKAISPKGENWSLLTET